MADEDVPDQVLDMGRKVMDLLMERKGCYLGVIYRSDQAIGCTGPVRTPEVAKERNDVYAPDYPGFVVDLRWPEEETLYRAMKWFESFSPFKDDPFSRIPLGLHTLRNAVGDWLEKQTLPLVNEVAQNMLREQRQQKKDE